MYFVYRSFFGEGRGRGVRGWSQKVTWWYMIETTYFLHCYLFYRPKTKFAKVMFSQVSVCPQGGVPGQVHPTGQVHSLAGTPSSWSGTAPWAGAPPWAGTPPGRYLPGRYTPSHSACWIQSTRGWYASHWNAFMLKVCIYMYHSTCISSFRRLLFRCFKFTLKPPYSIGHGKFWLAILDIFYQIWTQENLRHILGPNSGPFWNVSLFWQFQCCLSTFQKMSALRKSKFSQWRSNDYPLSV